MGKSTNSCFKIISCGSNSADAADEYEIEQTEGKASVDKRGWSFRKKSDRHRVLSNTAELSPSSGNKERPEAANVNFALHTNSTLPEKFPAASWDEKPTLSSANANAKVEDNLVFVENTNSIDCTPQESVVIMIQTAIRGYLAQKEFLKLKNLVKLQAVVRGHLVRRQAVGTLRCVQAIIKMQALVRARHARLLKERLAVQGNRHENTTDNLRLKHSEKEESVIEAKGTSTSAEYLFSNGFARQLLGSTLREKPIHINCDPSKPSSAWNWLERWMAASSKGLAHTGKLQLKLEYEEQGEKTELSASEVGAEDLFEVVPGLGHLKSGTEGTGNDGFKSFSTQLGDEDDSIAVGADGSDFQACQSTTALNKKFSSSATDDPEQAQLEEVGSGSAQEGLMKIREALKSTLHSLSNQVDKPLDATSGAGSVSNKPEVEKVNTNDTMERKALNQIETESKNFAFGLRKTCNPAFAAVQSKFEELSSKPNLGRTVGSSYHEVAVESRTDISAKDLSPTNDSVSHEPRAQIGGSECGTEISISSTLDSPVRSETEGGELVHKIRTAEHENSYPNNLTDVFPRQDLDAETKTHFSISETPSSSSDHVLAKPEKVEGIDRNFDNLDVDSTKAEQLPVEQSISDMQIQLDNSADRQVYKSSPDGSPRSRITAPESHGTPSSQISSNTQSSRATQKRRSQSDGKRSPSNQNNDSGGRSSSEHLPKDSKNGRRRKSFGLPRPDHAEHEQSRVSVNPLPNYMQATESAKAKSHPPISPKMSPEVQDRDILVKKRHSLTGNVKESSPKMQRSQSQAQQGAKGNDSYSPHSSTERKWIR